MRTRKLILTLGITVVALAVLAGSLIVHASREGTNYDTNGNGIIEASEAIEVARGYMRGDLTQDESLDYILWHVSGMTQYRRPTSTPTPTPIPTPVPTPISTPTQTPTPIDEPIPRLDCGDREFDVVESLQVSRHMDVTIVTPDDPNYAEGVIHNWFYGFSIIEDYNTTADPKEGTINQEGFDLSVTDNGDWLYRRVGETTFDKAVILQTGYLSDDGIPFDTSYGARNRITFLARDSEVDSYRFFVNGYKVPVEFTGIESIMSEPHERYREHRAYRAMQPYSYNSGFTFAFEDICLVNSWTEDPYQ